MKIGIFGGTFDPFTKAHAEIVEQALKIVDEVIIVPTSITYYRESKVPPLFNFDERLEIIRRYAEKANWTRVFVSAVEYGRPDIWRFVDTLKALRRLAWIKMDTEVYIIVGSDTFDKLDTWANYEEIVSSCKFIVAEGRDGKHSTRELPHMVITINEKNCSASEIRKKIVEHAKNEYIFWSGVNNV